LKYKHLIGRCGGKRENEKHHVITGINGISLAKTGKVKQSMISAEYSGNLQFLKD